jgi:SAM-dependent methyltransferase
MTNERQEGPRAVHEILRHLPEGVYVLDLGSSSGSFDPQRYPIITVAADLEPPRKKPRAHFVQADAARLPFRRGAFQAVIANHSLEHVRELETALGEIGRVLNADGALYAAVPGSATLTDGLYRWLARGGGHVNQFPSPSGLIAAVERRTGLRHIATRPLYTSLSFLNRKNRVARAPRKLLLLGGGNETVLLVVNWLLRLADRFLKTRLGLYGWALYFGAVQEPIGSSVWANVCVRCGAGHPSELLISRGLVLRRGLLRRYRCPSCGAMNPFVHDESLRHLSQQ